MRKQLIGALGAASLAVCGVALAGPTLVGTTDSAIGVDGVVVDSVTYNVLFSTSSFDSTFDSNPLAQMASEDLADALTTLSVTGLREPSDLSFSCILPTTVCAIFAGSSELGDFFDVAVRDSSHNWMGGVTLVPEPTSLGCPETLSSGKTACVVAAHWTKTSSSGAPEPATLALLGLGLVGLGLSRRRLAI